jgi:phosphoribosylanthranilate isomerase
MTKFMIWIKICGTTNLEDALTAIEAGADALGFVFYEKSPRNIDPEAAREVIEQLPPEIEKVGVFVNEPVEEILNTVMQAGLTAVQLHGVDCRRREFIRSLKDSRELKVFLVLQADEINGFEAVGHNEGYIGAVFVDSGTSQLPGGTGKTFDWGASAASIEVIRKNMHLVVAGGLTPANVTDAIRILKPWGVDVASGVEAIPGKKDPEKVRAFVNAVRNAEKKN